MVGVKTQPKVISVFQDRGIIVNKSLTQLNEQFRKLPSFVIDYLISQMVDPNNPTIGINRINELLNNHFMDSSEKELIKSRIRERGEYVLIGRIRCRLDETRSQYWTDVTVLGNQYIRIDHKLIAEYGDILLTTGAWGVFKIVYDESLVMRNKMYPFLIVEFEPIQITEIDVNSWIKCRCEFTEEEWLNLMVTSIGFDSQYFSAEEKWLYMVRLVPFVESNVNLCELGPPETGKTYSCQSLSSYSFVVSGGKTSVASLFYDKLRRQLGLIGYRDVIMFDEFTNINGANKWSGQNDLVDILKNYMNSSRFGRGTAEFASGCSIIFAGNIDCDRRAKKVSARYRNLFSQFPRIVGHDRAFIDRIHGFIPGWRISQIKECQLANDYGFMADYLSEIMHRMRNRNYAPIILHNVDFGEMSQRNQRSLVRIGCGLLKLIYPHRTVETVQKNELKQILDISIDLRQRVVDQLAVILPSEFSGIKLGYGFK